MKIYIWNEEFENAEEAKRLIVSLRKKEDFTEMEISEAVAKFPNVSADCLHAKTYFGDTRNLGEFWGRGVPSYDKDEIFAAQEWARARGDKCKVWFIYKCNQLKDYIAEFKSLHAEEDVAEAACQITEDISISYLIDNWFSSEKPSKELEESDPDEYEKQYEKLDEKVYKWFDELSPEEKLSYASGDWSCTVWEKGESDD